MMSGWAGWWLAGGLIMAFCMAMMVWMMAGMMSHGDSERDTDVGTRPERTLADRLARGEIDVEEYNKLLDVLRATRDSTRS